MVNMGVKNLLLFYQHQKYTIPVEKVQWHTEITDTVLKVPGLPYLDMPSPETLVWFGAFSSDNTCLVLSCYTYFEQVVRGTLLPIQFDPCLYTLRMRTDVFDSLFIKTMLPTHEDFLMKRITDDPLYDFEYVEHPWDDLHPRTADVQDLPMNGLMIDLDTDQQSEWSQEEKKKHMYCHKKYALTYTVHNKKHHALTSDIVAFLQDTDGTSLTHEQMFDLFVDAANEFCVYDGSERFDVTRDDLLEYVKNHMCM